MCTMDLVDLHGDGEFSYPHLIAINNNGDIYVNFVTFATK